MTITSDLSETIEYDDADLSDSGCGCWAPEEDSVEEPFSDRWSEPTADDVVTYGDDTWGDEQPVAPAMDEPAVPVDASAVIPAGQPGGVDTSAAIVSDELDWAAGGTEVQHLYPSEATIGGNPFGAMTITPGDAGGAAVGHEALGTIGGGQPDLMTITPGHVAAPAVGPFMASIGPAHDSPAAALGSLIGMPVDRGSDVLGQIFLGQAINGQQASTAISASSLH